MRVQAEDLASTPHRASVLNSERVKGSLRRFAPLTRCGVAAGRRHHGGGRAVNPSKCAMPPRARVVKIASKQKRFDSRERVFFISAQALEASSKNALNYDGSVSGPIIYSVIL